MIGRVTPAGSAPWSLLERALRPVVHIGGRAVSTFQICGTFGFACAGATALALGAQLGLSLFVFGLLIVAAAGVLFALAWVTLRILGSERLVYYHHEIAVLAVSALLLVLLDRPLLPYLDVAVLSLAVFLVFGRLGCSAVGCCYGKPHPIGWRYRSEHANEGFAHCLVGVRLFPVQIVESLCVLVLTVVAAWRLVAGAPPGETLATQLVSYAVLRFTLEFARGDEGRPGWKGFSEAQWTSLALALAVLAAEHGGWLPRLAWHGAAVLALGALFVLVAAARSKRQSPHQLLGADHIHEVARAIVAGDETTEWAGTPVRVSTTSLGVKLSSCTIAEGAARARLYTLSGVDGAAAARLAGLIRRLLPPGGASTLVERRPGLFQLIVRIKA